ncbi:MAG TPA: hypothetical protein VGF99_17510, partial [Myxococcota bacterium]
MSIVAPPRSSSATTSSISGLPRASSTLRLTWERGLADLDASWAAAERALRRLDDGLGSFSLRLALPFELDDAEQHADDIVHLARRLHAIGVALDVAPRVAGNRAVNTSTAATMHARLLPALAALATRLPSSSSSSSSIKPGVIVHLEPSPGRVGAAWAARRGHGLASRVRGLSTTLTGVASAVWMARQGRRDLVEFARDLSTQPFSVLATSPPPLLPLDTIAGSTALHWLLGCPDTSLWADDDGGRPVFGPTAADCFAPLLGTVVGARDRVEQHRALTLWAARHREKSHAVCLGPTSALAGIEVDDDAVYQSPAHLRQDVRAVRALGFSDITITSLDGLVLAGGE